MGMPVFTHSYKVRPNCINNGSEQCFPKFSESSLNSWNFEHMDCDLHKKFQYLYLVTWYLLSRDYDEKTLQGKATTNGSHNFLPTNPGLNVVDNGHIKFRTMVIYPYWIKIFAQDLQKDATRPCTRRCSRHRKRNRKCIRMTSLRWLRATAPATWFTAYM